MRERFFLIKTRKAQLQHAVIFLLMMLIIGVVALLGYKAINSLLKGSCELDRTAFEQEVPSLFSKYSAYGSLHNEDVELPCSYSEVCFVDASVYRNASSKVNPPADPKIREVLKSAEDNKVNIFLVGRFAEPAGYSPKVFVDNPDNYLCVKGRGGVARLRFKGLGKKTLVEER